MAKGMEHARTRAPREAKELDHIRLSKAENGGHLAEHHYTSYEHQPEKHVFGEDEGEKLHAHLSEHLGVSCSNCGEDTSEAKEDAEI